MEARHKRYLKINLVSLVFVAVSFISVTLAWFAYSGLTSANMEVGVKAWYIKLERDGDPISNNVVISLSDIYPGMDTLTETVNIKNLGDSDALLSYSIVSSRILDIEKIVNSDLTSEQVEDEISHEYPFHINMNMSKSYVLAENGEATFNVSLSWPLDSGNEGNNTDSEWGKAAYDFQDAENQSFLADNTYQKKTAIQVVINISAEQYLADDNSSDARYDLGTEVLFDPVTNTFCGELTNNCIKTYVIDKNNKIGDETVTLLPDLTGQYQNDNYSTYSSELSIDNWTATIRKPTINEILNVISGDIEKTVLVRENISDLIIGNLSYEDRMTNFINNTIEDNGYYKFENPTFPYLASGNCYWLDDEYDLNNAFAIETIDQNNTKIYAKLKTETCNFVPVIIANKIS